jgi:ABC-2 type transport system ATP-binding protein
VAHPAAVRVEALTKTYASRRVIDRLSFTVPAGSVSGFLGPNGAGKTTTLRVLLGLVRPTAGAAWVCGHSIERPDRYLARVGALIEAPAFYPPLSGRRNLEVLARLVGLGRSRIDAVLDQVELSGRDDDPYRSYSLGMKQRLGIAAALLRDPDMLILDEPMNGLDPAGMRDIRALLRQLADQGTNRAGVVAPAR